MGWVSVREDIDDRFTESQECGGENRKRKRAKGEPICRYRVRCGECGRFVYAHRMAWHLLRIHGIANDRDAGRRP